MTCVLEFLAPSDQLSLQLVCNLWYERFVPEVIISVDCLLANLRHAAVKMFESKPEKQLPMYKSLRPLTIDLL